MGRWTLLVPMLLLAGCMGAASESRGPPAAEQEAPAAFTPATMGDPSIEMGRARIGQAVALAALVQNAAEPVDYVWHIVGPQGETVLTGQSVEYTPLAPTDHQVRLDVHDAYDRSAEAIATMPVGLT